MKDYIADQVDYNINVVMKTLVELKNSNIISESKYNELWRLLNYCSEVCFEDVRFND